MASFFQVSGKIILQKSSLLVVTVVLLGSMQAEYVTNAILNFCLSSLWLVLLLSTEFYQVYIARESFGVKQIPFLRQVGKIAVYHLILLVAFAVLFVGGLIVVKATGESFLSLRFITFCSVSILLLFLFFLLGTAIVIHSESSFISISTLGRNLVLHGVFCLAVSMALIGLMVAQSTLALVPVFIESFPTVVVIPGKVLLGLVVYFFKCNYLAYLSLNIK